MRVPETTMREQCFAGSIDACVSLDKTNKQLYKDLENTQNQIAENNKVIKEHRQTSQIITFALKVIGNE